MAKLNAKSRAAIPTGEFALPGRRYPLNDRSHAQNALSRVSQFGTGAEKEQVRSKVHAMYGMADGGVVTPEPSRWSRLYDALFGQKALKQAGQTDNPPPAAPPQPQTDISGVRQAAMDAAARMQKAKDENKGVAPKQFACGGVVMGRYGK